MTTPAGWLVLLAALTWQRPDVGPGGEPVIDPATLARDPNLIGREITVDDRVRYFQAHKRPEGQVIDEVLLKRTEVMFLIPPGLRPEHPPRQPAARVSGLLRRDGARLVCDVTLLELLPSDLERLDKQVRRLAPGDSAGRAAWAGWALRRGLDFKDDALVGRARELETEAILIDADRAGTDSSSLVRRAHDAGLADVAGAILHRTIRPRVEAARSADDLNTLAATIRTSLPDSSTPKTLPGLADWEARVRSNPMVAYRNAPADMRAALDRDLLADTLERRLGLRLASAPGEAKALAAEATETLPDRPGVAARLRDRGLEETARDVTTMRLSEVEDLARTLRDDGQADRARTALRSWLDDRRRRLSPRDADGHAILAAQFDRLLDDRSTAVELLQTALRVDPDSKPVVDAFRRMGFRKSDAGAWYDPAGPNPGALTAVGSGEVQVGPPMRRVGSGSLRGMSLTEARSRLGGKPDRISRIATRDATIEQWVYQLSKGTHIVNVRRPRGSARPEVVSDYVLP